MNLFLLLLLCNLSIGQKVVPPVSFVKQQDAFFYERSTLVQFTVLTPFNDLRENNLLVTFPGGEQPCTDQSNSLYYCPLIYHLQGVKDSLKSLITTEDSLQNKESHILRANVDCGKFQPMYPSINTDNVLFVENTKTYFNCLQKSELINNTVTKFIENPIDLVYGNSKRSYNEYHDPGTDEAKQRSALILEEVLNVAGILNYFAEARRWEDSVTKCKLHNVLPPLLISTLDLESHLNKLQADAEKFGYELAVPITIDTASIYWTLPTVDCTFSGDSQVLTVHFSVPLKKKNTNWEMYKIDALPFHYQFNNKGYICYSKEFQQPKLIQYDGTSKVAYEAQESGKSSGFLKFVEPPKGFLKDLTKNCASKLIQGNIPNLDIVTYCPLACEPEVEFSSGGGDMVVKEVSRNIFYAAKSKESKTEFNVICPNQIFPVPLPVNGSTEFKIGCGCKFNIGDMTVEATIPCEGEGVTSLAVIPVQLQS